MAKKRGRPKKWTDAWARNCLAIANHEKMRDVTMTTRQWMDWFGIPENAYAFRKLRRYGETHGYPFYPEHTRGLRLGGRGDEAELVNYRAQYAFWTISKAVGIHDTMSMLPWYSDKIAPRIADHKAMPMLAKVAQKCVAALPRPRGRDN